MSDQTFVTRPIEQLDPAAPRSAEPVEPMWAPPAVPQRHGLKDRWRSAPTAARVGATGAFAVLLLLGFGLGGFTLGRSTAPSDGTTTGGTGDLGDRPDLRGGPGGPPGGMPGQGTAPDTAPDASTGAASGSSTWYVVPRSTSGTRAA